MVAGDFEFEKVEILKFVWHDSCMTSDVRCGREGGKNVAILGSETVRGEIQVTQIFSEADVL